MWILVVVVVLIIICILFIIFNKKIMVASHMATYYAETKLALEHGASVDKAMYGGLKQLQRQKFFNQLTEDDISILVESFIPLNDIKYLGALLANSIQDNDIAMLKNKIYIENIVKNLKNRYRL
ncbi:MAG: hypothetical protein Q8T08_13475 [Ignavibacteria bacterium]|nr:hypothetical protein [Ignavibacteria bacterium]